MSRLQCRGSIALAAVLVALLSSRPADAQMGAQIGIDPGPPREPGGLVNDLLTGVQYDIANQALAQKRLQHLQEKVRRDSERGNAAAVERDVRRMDNLTYRITIDEWLIRWNSLHNPGFYPIRTDPVSCAAIAQATHPIPFPYPPQLAATLGPIIPSPMMLVTIANVGPAGTSVAFDIDGVSYQAAVGSRQYLVVAPDSKITYDGGGSIGQRRYVLSRALYEFRSTPEGWVLYKLPNVP